MDSNKASIDKNPDLTPFAAGSADRLMQNQDSFYLQPPLNPIGSGKMGSIAFVGFTPPGRALLVSFVKTATMNAVVIEGDDLPTYIQKSQATSVNYLIGRPSSVGFASARQVLTHYSTGDGL